MFGGLSVYALVGALGDPGNSEKGMQHGKLVVPKYFDPTYCESKDPSAGDRAIIRINSFKKYMDSLSKSSQARLVYDSILKARPGLMDSIQIIEEIYYSQSK